MKEVGIIKSVQLDRTGTMKESGKPFESYKVFFEGGGDKHIVDVFITLGGNMTGTQVLERRGLVEGAIGEMEMRYDVDSYNDRWYRRCQYVSFRLPKQPTITHDEAPASEEPSANEVAAGFAAEADRVEINPETGLPF